MSGGCDVHIMCNVRPIETLLTGHGFNAPTTKYIGERCIFDIITKSSTSHLIHH